MEQKEETTKAKEKEKATTKEAKAKASTGVKDTTKDSTKAAKETTTKEDTTRAKEKATQDPKDMDQAKATKAKETTANQKEKETTTTQHATDVASLATGHKTAECQYHIGEGEELHPLEHEELPQDVNDTWNWYYEGEEGQHEVNYMEENWNDYDYDNSWDWNDNSYEDTANYIEGINESHLTIGHIRQSKSRLHKHKSKSLLGKRTTQTTSWDDHSKSFQQFLQEDTTQLHFDIAAAGQQQRNKKIEDTITHYIMYSNDRLRSIYTCLPEGLHARTTATTLWGVSSTALHGYQQEDPCLRNQVRSLQAGQLQDHDTILRL